MYKSHILSLSLPCLNLVFSPFLASQRQPFSLHKRNLPSLVAVSSNSDNVAGENGGGMSEAKKGSGTTARGRRLLKVREEKRKRDYDRLHDYPSWAKVLESACKDDEELRAVLGDSIGNPELMRKKVEERVRKKGKDFQKQKTGSVLSFKLANSSMEYDPLYDAEKGFKVMPSSFHDISDVEFQDNWGRVWVDLGTSDIFALDVLLNSLTVVGSEYLGIQQVVFGGKRMGDWEEGMTNPDFGYNLDQYTTAEMALYTQSWLETKTALQRFCFRNAKPHVKLER
ncbi:hypothetical protein Bca101_000378 [Brassica carinata]